MKNRSVVLFAVISIYLSVSGFTKYENKNKQMTTQKTHTAMVTATFGGGCFWCIEAIFSGMNGVDLSISGFAGGHVKNPTYEQVVTGSTGHAEVVQVHYNPDVISYVKLLEVFFSVHDPTTLNRQGNDIGTQYRSAIFFHNQEQEDLANKVISRLNQDGIYDDPIVTEVTPLEAFYQASDYHQNYFERNPNQGYCQMVIRPKVEKFRKTFEHLLAD